MSKVEYKDVTHHGSLGEDVLNSYGNEGWILCYCKWISTHKWNIIFYRHVATPGYSL